MNIGVYVLNDPVRLFATTNNVITGAEVRIGVILMNNVSSTNHARGLAS